MTPHRPSLLALVAYLLAVLALGFIHHPALLALALLVALLAAGRARWRYLKRSVLAILAFNLCVSVGYALMQWWQQGQWPWWTLARMNLRVSLMVFLGIWFIHRVNVLRALACSPALMRLAALAAGQAMLFARMVEYYRLASISRSVGMRLPLRQRLHHGARLCTQLVDKSVTAADEAARAMRARGCFDD